MAPSVTKATQGVLPVMRTLLYVASGLVLTISVLLYVFSDNTATLFAWTIAPPLTAAFMGAGYFASFFLEFYAARETEWARARVAAPSVFAFTTLTLVATLLHLDKFHLDAAQFNWFTLSVTYVWIGVYAVVPLALGLGLFLQLRASGSEPARGTPLPSWLRAVVIAQGALFLVLGLALFLMPQQFATPKDGLPPLALWPWALTPLTARAVAAWLIGFGVAGLNAAWENDGARLTGLFVGEIAFSVATLLAIARYAVVFSWDARGIVFLVMTLVLLGMGAFGLRLRAAT